MQGLKIAALALVGGLAVIGVNHLRVNAAAQNALKGPEHISVWAYYRYGASPSSIVFDIRSVAGEASAASVIGDFLRFAQEMRNRDFDHVYLASRGSVKFRISGAEFKQIGQEFSLQNPVYLLRTLPEKLETPDGGRAFPTWTGGLIGVLGQQMKDVQEFSLAWWMVDNLPPELRGVGQQELLERMRSANAPP